MNWLNKIIKGPHPVLARVCDAVSSQENLNWLDDLERVTRKCKIAAGLAAPQIGIAKRAFFTFAHEGGTIRGRLFINPEIIERSPEKNLANEGCLSYPGPQKAILRHDWVVVRYCGRDFIPRQRKFEGFIARVIQHEADHLEGICKVGDESYLADGELPEQRRGPAMILIAAALASM